MLSSVAGKRSRPFHAGTMIERWISGCVISVMI